MLIALAATTTMVTIETKDSTAIKAFTLTVSGMASVGENAEALVKET